MRIAFVCQPIDAVVSPIQSSIGAVTWNVARALGGRAEVSVFGRRGFNVANGTRDRLALDGVDFRFVRSPAADYTLRAAWPAIAGVQGSLRRGGELPLSTSRARYPGFGKRVARALAAEPWDVVHVQHCLPYLPAIRRRVPGAKLVVQLHKELYRQSARGATSRWLRVADLVLATSDHVRDRLVALFPELAGRCATVYDPVDVEEIARVPRRPEPGGRRRILYVGAVSPHKGVHVLLEAFGRVAPERDDVELEIVGPWLSYPLAEVCDTTDPEERRRFAALYRGRYVERLERQRDALGPEVARRVTLTGPIRRADLLERYASATAFVFPSLSDEGFGIPPVEAMAAGVPVVASRSGALLETVRDGETGLLVEPGDPAALAGAILRLFGDDAMRARLGTAAARDVRRRFAADVVAGGLLEAYGALLGSAR